MVTSEQTTETALSVTEKVKEFGYAIAKGGIGSVPVIGPIAAELLGVCIPNKRLERVEAMLQRLAKMTENMDQEKLTGRMTEEEYSELFEELAYQAARAKTESRIKAISQILFSGINPNANIAELQKYLSVIGELDDLDLLIMLGFKKKDDERDIAASHAPVRGSDYDFTWDEAMRIGDCWYSLPNGSMHDEDINITISEAVSHSLARCRNSGLIEERKQSAEDRSPENEYNKRYLLTLFGTFLMDYFNDERKIYPESHFDSLAPKPERV